MTAELLVSIIIPTYYRNEQLRAAIESAEDQTYDPIEIIVVDDSGDRYAKPTCTGYDVTYVAHEENRGGNPARNTGITHAAGEYIQLLDDDDKLASTKVEKQVDLLASSPETGVVYCGMLNTDGDPILPDQRVRGDVHTDMLRLMDLNPCQTGTMLIEADVLDAIHPLVKRDAADDVGMKIRLARLTEFDYVDEVLFYKGKSDSHRHHSAAFAKELENIIEDNREAYDAAPDAVYRSAMRSRYSSEASYALDGSLWSLDAIQAYWRGLQRVDGFDPMLTGLFLSSLFGKPGRSIASAVFQTLSSLSTSRSSTSQETGVVQDRHQRGT